MRTFCGVGAMVLPSWTRRTYRTPQSPRGRPFTGPGDLWRGSSQAGRGVFGFPEALTGVSMDTSGKGLRVS